MSHRFIAWYTLYIVFLATCSADRIRRIELGSINENREDKITLQTQAGTFSLIHMNGISGDNSDINHNRRSIIEQSKIEAKSKVQTTKSARELGTTHSSTRNIQKTRQNHVQGTSQKANFSQVQQGQLNTQGLRGKKSHVCKGMKKIVQCKNDVPEEICKQDLVEAGVEVLSDMPSTPFFSICANSEAEILLVAELTDVEGVEDDPPRTLSYIPSSEVIRRLQSNEQITPYGVELVKAPEFWETYGNRGDGVKVCVIDTGLRRTHEDLKDHDLSGSNGYGLVTPWDEDIESHGTHVTGTIAATDNNIGVVGVAPDASIHVVRVFNDGGEFTASTLVDAMTACATAGAKIVSMSLGGPIETNAEQIAIQNLKNSGVLFIAASGNNGDSTNEVEYPAGYESVLSVGAVNENSEIASFSTYNNVVDIVAPGVSVLSTTSESDQSYAEFDGTSMATPHVSGIAALLWSHFPDSSVDDIQNAILLSARDTGACGKDRVFGHGVVDAMAAAAYLESGGSEASELDGCISVNISLTTDDWGAETTYVITPYDSMETIVYRGGPFPSSQRSTYIDDFQLEGACYKLILLDSAGDGTNNPDYGIGEINLTYNGNKVVEFNDFGGSEEVFQFGNCGENNPSPTTPPGGNPTSSPLIDPTPSPTQAYTPPGSGNDKCSSGESYLEMILETDLFSLSENHLYLFDTAASDDEWFWLVNLHELLMNSEYTGSACLVQSKCYQFYYFDNYGDGFAYGGLTLRIDGNIVLQILPGDVGTLFEPGISDTRYWSYDFGSCA